MECNIEKCEALKLVQDLGLRILDKNYVPKEVESLVLVRDADNSGFGRLYLRGVYLCDSLENPSYLMPYGMYQMRITNSPKFKKDLPQIFIPTHSGVRIHAGNYRSDSKGCVLVGVKSGTDCLKNSTVTLERVIENIRLLNINYFKIS